jgi:hypothetical protein
MFHSEITTQRTLTIPSIVPPDATATGSICTVADADGNRDQNGVINAPKLIASPGHMLDARLLDAAVGPVVSPIVPGTTALAHASIDFRNSSQVPLVSLTIVSQQKVDYTLTTGVGPTLAQATARTRDPLDLGYLGLGGPIIIGTPVKTTIKLLGAGAVASGGTFASQQHIIPRSVSDPDIYDNLPPDASLVYQLVIDHTRPIMTVTFTAGSSDDFSFTFSMTPVQIAADVLAYLGGAEFQPFDVTITNKRVFPDETLLNQDRIFDPIDCIIPEPSSLLLGIMGAVVVAVVLRTKRG